MIYTARQLEDLHKTNGHVTLPVGARLTPMAHDWARSRKVAIVFDEQRAPAAGAASAARSSPTPTAPSSSPAPAGQILWWCDGPCGAAKAALAAVGREANVQPMTINAEPKFLVGAIRHLAKEIKTDRAAAGILLVQSGAAAAVYANRCPSLRAILGTCRDAVQQGLDQVGANVLIVETPHQTLQQVRNVLSLFVRMRRTPSEDVKRQLKALADCG